MIDAPRPPLEGEVLIDGSSGGIEAFRTLPKLFKNTLDDIVHMIARTEYPVTCTPHRTRPRAEHIRMRRGISLAQEAGQLDSAKRTHVDAAARSLCTIRTVRGCHCVAFLSFAIYSEAVGMRMS
jgi:hypothetical protein